MKTSTDSTILAAYLRLSREDGDITEGKEERNSITNCRASYSITEKMQFILTCPGS